MALTSNKQPCGWKVNNSASSDSAKKAHWHVLTHKRSLGNDSRKPANKTAKQGRRQPRAKDRAKDNMFDKLPGEEELLRAVIMKCFLEWICCIPKVNN